MDQGALALERWSRQSRGLSNGLDVVVHTRGDHGAAELRAKMTGDVPQLFRLYRSM